MHSDASPDVDTPILYTSTVTHHLNYSLTIHFDDTLIRDNYTIHQDCILILYTHTTHLDTETIHLSRLVRLSFVPSPPPITSKPSHRRPSRACVESCTDRFLTRTHSLDLPPQHRSRGTSSGQSVLVVQYACNTLPHVCIHYCLPMWWLYFSAEMSVTYTCALTMAGALSSTCRWSTVQPSCRFYAFAPAHDAVKEV